MNSSFEMITTLQYRLKAAHTEQKECDRKIAKAEKRQHLWKKGQFVPKDSGMRL